MNSIRNLNLDVLKRPRVLFTILFVIVAVIAWYLFWWSHESSKLDSVHQEQATQQAQISQLTSQLAQVTHDSQIASKLKTYLTLFDTAVPVQPEQGQLVSLIGALGKADNVNITSLSDSSTAPPIAPATLSTIPVAMTLTGSHEDLIKFLGGLYTLPRLMTIQSVTPSATGATGGGAQEGVSTINILKSGDPTQYSMGLTGTAYFTGQIAPSP